MSSRRLIIIGGMGADAGVRVAQYAIQEARNRGAERDCDFPDFVLYNLPAQGMDETGVTDKRVLFNQLVTALNHFNRIDKKENVAIIACNSVHDMFYAIKEQYSGLLLNMVEAACDAAKAKHKCVGVLCSQSSNREGLYTSALEKRGIKAIAATTKEQEVLNAAIENVIRGRDRSEYSEKILKIMFRMHKDGARAIIVGCTELPFALYQDDFAVPLIDAGLETVKKALSLL